MDWHFALGIAAGLIATGAIIPYLRDMVRGTTRPNIISWLIWTAVVSITAIAQVNAGASWSLFLLVGTILANLSVLALCLRGYGYRKVEVIDMVCLAFGVAAILFWWLTSNPITAIVLAVLADAIAYIPTYAKVRRHPDSEAQIYWAALVFADILALLSVTAFTLANTLFPITYGLLNLGVLAVVRFSKK